MHNVTVSDWKGKYYITDTHTHMHTSTRSYNNKSIVAIKRFNR